VGTRIAATFERSEQWRETIGLKFKTRMYKFIFLIVGFNDFTTMEKFFFKQLINLSLLRKRKDMNLDCWMSVRSNDERVGRGNKTSNLGEISQISYQEIFNAHE
jgi:hypothetical protein